MTRIVAVVALVWTSLALAEAPPEFVKLRDDPNTRVLDQGLGAFLDKYVGDCSAMDGDECRQNAKAFRAKVNGHRYYMIVGEDAVSQLAPGPYDPRGSFILHITPFFPAAGFALTQGAPSRTDANGNPVMPLIQVKVTKPEEGWTATSLGRLISMHAFRLQVIFEPQDVWTLPKKGGGKMQGVKAKIVAILVSGARTGSTLALWTKER